VPDILSNLLAVSIHLSQLTFNFSPKRQFVPPFSRYILSNVFNQFFHIATVFQNRPFDLFCLSCHVCII